MSCPLLGLGGVLSCPLSGAPAGRCPRRARQGGRCRCGGTPWASTCAGCQPCLEPLVAQASAVQRLAGRRAGRRCPRAPAPAPFQGSAADLMTRMAQRVPRPALHGSYATHRPRPPILRPGRVPSARPARLRRGLLRPESLDAVRRPRLASRVGRWQHAPLGRRGQRAPLGRRRDGQLGGAGRHAGDGDADGARPPARPLPVRTAPARASLSGGQTGLARATAGRETLPMGHPRGVARGHGVGAER